MVDDPAHIAVGAPAEIEGAGFTATVAVSVFVQPLAAVPVTVYWVVAGGVAVVVAHGTHDNPVEGAQE